MSKINRNSIFYKAAIVICKIVFFIGFMSLLLWGESISENLNIDPTLFNMGLVIAVMATLIVSDSLYKKLRYKKYKNKAQRIQKLYPLAYDKFRLNYFLNNPHNCYNDIPELSELKTICSRDDTIWSEEEALLKEERRRRILEDKECSNKAKQIKEHYPDGYNEWKEKHHYATNSYIVKYEAQIVALQKHLNTIEWEKSQALFSQLCYNLNKTLLPTYGRYYYRIPFTKFSAEGDEIPGLYVVWQSFAYAFCKETDIDYTHCPYIKQNTEILSKGQFVISDSIVTQIAEYINKLDSEEDTAIYFCPAINEKYKEYYRKCYVKIQGKFAESISRDLICDQISDDQFGFTSDLSLWAKHIKRRIVVVDFATENNRLINICRKLIDVASVKRPLITFVSILKGHDRREMLKIVENKQKQIAADEEKKRAEEDAHKSFIEAVNSWPTLNDDLHYHYFVNYYPTTCDFEATEEEWEIRKLVWDFKNAPGWTSHSIHEAALNNIVRWLRNKLLKTFGADKLKYLTLVCIPASSSQKTKARYEEFSNIICKELGLINAFPYITVLEEASEKRLGGAGLDIDNLRFEKNFFKGKYVLLFDDIITRGDTMNTFKRKMEQLDATVVCGIALGKTKHHRD